VSMEMHGRPRYISAPNRSAVSIWERGRERERERASARAIAYPSSRVRFFAPFPEDLYFTSQSRAASRAGVAGANAKKKEKRAEEREREKYIKICGSKRKTGYDPAGRLL